ncbi:DUF938 domain-containing protein [Sulfitobacter donghicola]|uniref:Methyltransferase n=1 Tax=Sulfitobacter donghicola DSW-25 = KCTC 12864 = JCM 14565 TaxID=1300350 RepID=A0A073IUB7_9RHOB|nr:DUF938 domain-containing protein [Sulfitobacter donghicola]KEJ88982.1 methyltransferase [Sulfitobacter donghicola DSW-25 = KCTC 12864 = JCM 14565]KIN67466.1 generic methyltransferase [Sulfitobacter donghicola DSW-25 = KCTC 12864 = JCM 14565]
MSKLPASASVAADTGDGKLVAPSALRNVTAIVDLLQKVAPETGRALEIASGTGQHALAFATAFPTLDWHPTEAAPDRLTSINIYVEEANLSNLHPATALDASINGWGQDQPPADLIYLGNLLHLISAKDAQTVLCEAAQALAPQGRFVIYGPFKRNGLLTSEGDVRFDADLRGSDPDIGYKDDQWVKQVLTQNGLQVSLVQEMPANNLAIISKREPT